VTQDRTQRWTHFKPNQ